VNEKNPIIWMYHQVTFPIESSSIPHQVVSHETPCASTIQLSFIPIMGLKMGFFRFFYSFFGIFWGCFFGTHVKRMSDCFIVRLLHFKRERATKGCTLSFQIWGFRSCTTSDNWNDSLLIDIWVYYQPQGKNYTIFHFFQFLFRILEFSTYHPWYFDFLFSGFFLNIHIAYYVMYWKKCKFYKWVSLTPISFHYCEKNCHKTTHWKWRGANKFFIFFATFKYRILCLLHQFVKPTILIF